MCAQPQPEPCLAWLCSRPRQPTRHALFRGFQVDRLRGEPPQAQGGGRRGRLSPFSWFVHTLTSAPASAGSWRQRVLWPFQFPPTLPVSPAAPPAPTTSLLLCTGCGRTPEPSCGFSSFPHCSWSGAGRRQHRRPAKWRPEASNGLFPLFCPRELESPTCHLPHVL